ncbi:hypothetical protein ABW21_db0204850 [Orbilia brochopaga]|nr:hypothetical protein ABW21_db0204850 [Drechslerella brochopaga]
MSLNIDLAKVISTSLDTRLDDLRDTLDASPQPLFSGSCSQNKFASRGGLKSPAATHVDQSATRTFSIAGTIASPPRSISSSSGMLSSEGMLLLAVVASLMTFFFYYGYIIARGYERKITNYNYIHMAEQATGEPERRRDVDSSCLSNEEDDLEDASGPSEDLRTECIPNRGRQISRLV